MGHFYDLGALLSVASMKVGHVLQFSKNDMTFYVIVGAVFAFWQFITSVIDLSRSTNDYADVPVSAVTVVFPETSAVTLSFTLCFYNIAELSCPQQPWNLPKPN